MILIFAFSGTIAETIAKRLPVNHETVDLDSTTEAIEQFISSTDFSKYTHIIGLGQYSGSDQDKIRIETECTSQFRNNKENLQALNIPYFIQPNDHMKLAKGMGNSWCNLVSYKLLTKAPNANFTFLHIPKRFEVSRAMEAIQGIID